MADETVVIEQKPPEDMSKDELRAAIEAQAGNEKPADQPAETKVDTKTFEFKAGDGTTYSAESQDELFAKITGALNHTKSALKDRERQIHEIKATKPKEEKQTPANTDASFDKVKYYALMEEDPLKAQDYLETHRPKPEWQQKAEEREQGNQAKESLQREIMGFYASPAGQQYAKVETPELNAALLQYMADQGMDRTSSNFRAAFYELRDSGTIPQATEKTTVTRPKAPPKSPNGSTTQSTSAAEPDTDKMSRAELAEYLRSKGIEVYAR